MIYFVECLGADAIKIGYTRGVANGSASARVSVMQSSCPLPMKLLAAIPGSIDYERELQGRFSDAWIRGEWFRATDELRAFVAQFPEPPLPPRHGDQRYNRRPVSASGFPLVFPAQGSRAAVSREPTLSALE